MAKRSLHAFWSCSASKVHVLVGDKFVQNCRNCKNIDAITMRFVHLPAEDADGHWNPEPVAALVAPVRLPAQLKGTPRSLLEQESMTHHESCSWQTSV